MGQEEHKPTDPENIGRCADLVAATTVGGTVVFPNARPVEALFAFATCIAGGNTVVEPNVRAACAWIAGIDGTRILILALQQAGPGADAVLTCVFAIAHVVVGARRAVGCGGIDTPSVLLTVILRARVVVIAQQLLSIFTRASGARFDSVAGIAISTWVAVGCGSARAQRAWHIARIADTRARRIATHSLGAIVGAAFIGVRTSDSVVG
jgi:hypothetical protein